MGATAEIIKMAKDNNSIVTTAMVAAAGFSRGNLNYLVEKGMLAKAARGIYTLPTAWEDEIFNLQNRFKRGIFSQETALFLWDLTDRTPNTYSMTFPINYNVTKPKEEKVKCTQCKAEWYEIGIEKIKTPGGNMVQAYNKERTLCDILRTNSTADIQITSESFKRYTADKKRNIPLLSEYAKVLKVETKLRNYLEVLL